MCTGAGYHLVIVKAPTCNVEAVTAAVEGIITGAYLESQVAAELSYLLPEDQSSKFPQLFRMIETSLEKLGISSFGASATTMEEVFLKLVCVDINVQFQVQKIKQQHENCQQCWLIISPTFAFPLLT